jgi:hypothetical protein
VRAAQRTFNPMPIDQVSNAPWSRKHDLPGSSRNAPSIIYPSPDPGTLDELIAFCAAGRPAGERLHATGSHWALSEAAVSDHTFVETHDPNNGHPAMGRTLHEVVPNCLSDSFLDQMAKKHPPPFEKAKPPATDIFDDTANYLVHVETGKRIYQLYAELDQNAEDDPDGLARFLERRNDTQAYFGPWAFRTLGGAGGQTVFGALTTGTHGGDFNGPPIADDVAALHLIADGGMHYWIEPRLQPEEVPLTDDDRLMKVYGPKGGGSRFKIIRDDEIFHAVLVAAGRFGIVYSIVLRGVRQFMLHEERTLPDSQPWQTVRGMIADRSGALYTTPRENKFLQIVVCPTPFFDSRRNLAAITKRRNEKWDATSPPKGRAWRVGDMGASIDPQIGAYPFARAGLSVPLDPDENDPNKVATADFKQRACQNARFMEGVLESAIEELRQLIEENKVVAGGGIATVAAIEGTAGLLALAVPLAAILLLLLAYLASLRASGGGQRVGQVMNEVKGELLNRSDPAERAAGAFAWQLIAYKVFHTEQGHTDYTAISYAVMDTHDYLDLSCNVNVDSIEVFFEATNPMLIAFVDALLAYEVRQERQGKAFVGYMSLRFIGKTNALLGPARWDRTCVVEVAGLKDVSGVTELIDFAITMARNPNFKAILHWGQRNESDAADIEFQFGDRNDPRNGDLGRWREALAEITDKGQLDGFSSAFTRATGLEVV